MRDEDRFERMAGPRMSEDEFFGIIPSVYDRLDEYRRIIEGCASLETARKEFERIFKTEAK